MGFLLKGMKKKRVPCSIQKTSPQGRLFLDSTPLTPPSVPMSEEDLSSHRWKACSMNWAAFFIRWKSQQRCGSESSRRRDS